MRLCSCLVLALLVFAEVQAQSPYFQQEVAYHLEVRLDDQQHQLHGQWALTYTNHSPDTLHELYLHLWPNAYANRSTAFADQQLRQGSRDFYFAPEEDLGFIDSLTFRQNETPLETQVTEWGPDVIRLPLAKPLAPGDRTSLSTPFRVQLPRSFSRLGHVAESYQITQWYPKPAVYDRDGWHPMPYLDNGEFYSEFGTFDVRITLPDNYVVAATGKLQTEAELAWLLERGRQVSETTFTEETPERYRSPSFPASSPRLKTLHYRAERVHDFAWFADKRFHVLHDTCRLGDDQVIDVWAFFTDEQAHLWQHSLAYLKRATRYYSRRVGAYPYPQVTAAQSVDSKGGGMEYPMITLIGWEDSDRSLDGVITHEVGHNWFYGILGSNERDHAWMDEGLNSFYDQSYDERYYPAIRQDLPMTARDGEAAEGLIAYWLMARRRRDQAPETTSDSLRLINYWLAAYEKPAQALRQLETAVGQEAFDRAMQAYHREWAFRHPGPADLRRSLEGNLNRDLSWLFQGFLGSTAWQDYGIRRVHTESDSVFVELRNRGTVAGPVSLLGITDERDTVRREVAGFSGQARIGLPPADYRYLRLDPGQHSLDLYPHDNAWQRGARLPTWRKYGLSGAGLRRAELYPYYLVPALAWNHYDGLQLGATLFNRLMLARRLEWLVAPMYGLRSKKLTGVAGFRYRWYPRKGWLREVRLGGNYRQFHRDYFAAGEERLAYRRWEPSVQLHLRGPGVSPTRHWLQWRAIGLAEEELRFSSEGTFLGTDWTNRWIHEAGYHRVQPSALAPQQLVLALEYQAYEDAFGRDQSFVKLRTEWQGRRYFNPDDALHFRFFGGLFLHHSINNASGGVFLPPQAFSLFDRGVDDYRHDQFYFGRTETEGWASQQLGRRAGGFKTPVPAAFQVGRSNHWMLALNLAADAPPLPPWLPLQPYLDAALYRATTLQGPETKLAWNAGLALQLLDGRVGLYLPLIGSTNLMDRLREDDHWLGRVSFRLLIRDLAPWQFLDEAMEY